MDAPGAKVPASHDDLAREVDALVDECRTIALWSLGPGYYPRTDEERRGVLLDIQRHGDVDAFQRAARLLTWLSRLSSAASAPS